MKRAILLLLVAMPAWALPPEKAQLAVAAARELLGRTYQLGGRLRGAEGIDCQGLVFYALERINSCGWKSYSVMPTESVRDKELGDKVQGLFPGLSDTLDPSQLQAGDVVMLLADVENPKEPPMVTLDDGTRLWVWHVGLATGEGKWIQADPFSGQVFEGELMAYLREHQYAGIAVTRMERGPKPRQCRRHAPMVAEKTARRE